jgi:hypothetical protein
MQIDLGNIDWAKLREQKYSLISICSTLRARDGKDKDNLEGLIYLIDHIQDEAEKQIGEVEVFGIQVEE